MELKAEVRIINGKKVKTLRRDGLVPAVLYGHQKSAVSLTLPLKNFQRVYFKAGESELVDLVVGTNTPIKVLIKAVQREPVSALPTHADFYQVNLSEKVTTMVPIKIIGESQAVKSGQAMLLIPLAAVEVEALPLDLPSEILVDISSLVSIGDHLAVKDLKVDSSKVTIQHTTESIVVKLDYPEMKEEEVKEEVTPEEVEITKEKKDEESEGAAAGMAEKAEKGKKEAPPKDAKEKLGREA